MEHKFSKIRTSHIAHRTSHIAARESRLYRREIYFSAAFLRPFALLLFPALLLGCDPPSGSGGGSAPNPPAPPAPPKNLQSILQDGTLPTPSELATYDQVTADILGNLAGNTAKKLGIIYVTEAGNGSLDGSSWENAYAAAELKTAIDNAAGSAENPYLVMVAEGSYAISETLSMKNHVAIMGGFSGNGVDRGETTTLDGGGSTQVFFNSDLDKTAVLYGVTISNGGSTTNLNGGGMLNTNSSPTLSHVTFSRNTASDGGGMSNINSSPTLTNVIFSGNTANRFGGGMRNSQSSPTLTHVTFSGNTAKQLGGGMANSSSSPTLTHVTFSGNTAKQLGGGMANSSSSPTLTNVTFSGNTAKGLGSGGGMYNSESSTPALINVTFSENTAPKGSGGGGMYNILDPDSQSRPFVVNSIFWGNTDAFGNRASSQITSMDSLEISDSIVQGHTDRNLGLSDGDPQLKALQDNGGFVQTRALPKSGSPAINKGLSIRKHGVRIYRKDETSTQWRSFDTSNGSRGNEEPPSEAIDLTATDARGYARTGRPDLGAFESGGAAP